MHLIIGILCVAIILVCLVVAREEKQMQSYWQRACTGKAWRLSFPTTAKDDIRTFLDLFIEAFGFRNCKRLCFAPQDQVMAIYRCIYPSPGWDDSLKVLVMSLEACYSIKVTDAWRDDITLGELFQLTQQTTQKAGSS